METNKELPEGYHYDPNLKMDFSLIGATLLKMDGVLLFFRGEVPEEQRRDGADDFFYTCLNTESNKTITCWIGDKNAATPEVIESKYREMKHAFGLLSEEEKTKPLS